MRTLVHEYLGLTDLMDALVIDSRGFSLEGKGNGDGLVEASLILLPRLVEPFVLIIERKLPRAI